MLLFANAKINIGLNITRKRDDGYHELQTVFYPIPLFDIIEILPNNKPEISFTTSGLQVNSTHEDNLCVKAYRIMEKRYNIPGFIIHLHKHIPFGSGLGGGSADAAFVLKGINQMANMQLSNNTLREIALELGADCPFFIDNVPAYAKGIGEKLTPLPDILHAKYVLLILPEIFISTTEAYKNIQPELPNFNLTNSYSGNPSNWKNEITNQFEHFAFTKHSELLQIKKELYARGAIYASMSGSGSAMYGIFEKEPTSNFSPYTHRILKLDTDK
jgi:4-diphosphocytidyl-2-C-methyl-D-erythritol kinase